MTDCDHVWVTFSLEDDVLVQECSRCKEKRERTWGVEEGEAEGEKKRPPVVPGAS